MPSSVAALLRKILNRKRKQTLENRLHFRIFVCSRVRQLFFFSLSSSRECSSFFKIIYQQQQKQQRTQYMKIWKLTNGSYLFVAVVVVVALDHISYRANAFTKADTKRNIFHFSTIAVRACSLLWLGRIYYHLGVHCNLFKCARTLSTKWTRVRNRFVSILSDHVHRRRPFSLYCSAHSDAVDIEYSNFLPLSATSARFRS